MSDLFNDTARFLGVPTETFHHYFILDNWPNVIIANVIFLTLCFMIKQCISSLFKTAFEYKHPVLTMMIADIIAVVIATGGLIYIVQESSYNVVYAMSAGWCLGFILCAVRQK